MQLPLILFLLFVVATAYALFLLVWVAVLFALKWPHKRLLAALSLPAFAAILIGYRAYCTRSSEVFRLAFGFDPPPDVEILDSSFYYFGDGGRTYLHFLASPKTINRIVARGLYEVGVPTTPGFSKGFVGIDPMWDIEAGPAWWPPDVRPSMTIYREEFPGRDFSSEWEVLFYDPTTREADFKFSGVD